MTKLTASVLAIGLFSAIGITSFAAPPINVTPIAPTQPIKIAPLPDAARAPTLKLKNQQGLSFLPLTEVQKAAAAAAQANKKVLTPASSTPPSVDVTFTSQPEGMRLFTVNPWLVQGESNRLSVSLRANMVPTFNPNKGYAGIEILAKAGTIYAVDCPSLYGPRGMYRITTGRGASAVVRYEPAPAAASSKVITHFAARDEILTIDVQGHLLDGEEYAWAFEGCKVTTFQYAS
jgi:hypothetical protein